MSSQDSTELAINNTCQPKNHRFSIHQWRLLIIISCVTTFSAMCYSIQAPFYPTEAKKKGMSASVYGMVFGVFELSNFILCPLFGKYISHIGPKFMLNGGSFVLSISCIIFGIVSKTSKTAFIALSFIVRIVEGIGQAAHLTSSFAILASEFPNDVALAFTVADTAYAIGITVGPGIGGLLYELGGFFLPFVVNGGILLFASILTAFLLPQIEDAQPRSKSILKFLLIPPIAISYYAVFTVAFSNGFTAVLFEPFLRSQFEISSSIIGLTFLIIGASYAGTSYLWGMVADKFVHPMLVITIGSILLGVSFLLIGPAPFLSIKPALWLVIVSLITYGFGLSALYAAAFINSNLEALYESCCNRTPL